MSALYERSILGTIEYHELLGEYDKAREIKQLYDIKKKKYQQKEYDMMIKKNQVFEGILTAAGWDRLENVIRSSLFTLNDEDILLEHCSGMRKFKPYLNQQVRITGDILSSKLDSRKILVKKISRLNSFTNASSEMLDNSLAA